MDRLLRRAPRPPKSGEDGAGYTPLQALEQGSRRPGYGATHQHDQDQDQRQSFCEFDHQISTGFLISEMQQAPPPLWRDGEEVVKGVLYGLINVIMLVPVTASFATIIFRHEAYAPYLPGLVRLVLFASTVHAAVFTGLSSMNFAIGQVQDAGLIFLSAMASTIAEQCHGRPDRELVSTALVLLSLATATLGVVLIVVGKLHLASVVQYLPMSVVGGYLAFIGFYCGEAGLAFMTQLQINSLLDWPLLLDRSALLHLAPGLALGLLMYMLVRRVRHVLTLPACMAVAVLAFYASLAVSQTTLQQAREAGWVAPLSPPAAFYEAWELIDFRAVQWWIVPRLFPTWVALTLVVAFSSSLDVAAIETEVCKPLDYSGELQMIGVSNLITGLLGAGFTGSYIFSQTIFTLRAGVRSRLCTTVVVVLELTAFVSPVSLIAYVPRFFFGGLLVLIATDLMHEWLWSARAKMMAPEYLTCLCTFIAIQASNIEVGMGVGVVLAIVSFAFSYAKAPAVMLPRVKHSTVVRTFEERQILSLNMDKVMTMSLRGYLFFGSSVKILNDVKAHLHHLQHRPPHGTVAASDATAINHHPINSGSSPRPTVTLSSSATAPGHNQGTEPSSVGASEPRLIAPPGLGGSLRHPGPLSRSGSNAASAPGSYRASSMAGEGPMSLVYNRGGGFAPPPAPSSTHDADGPMRMAGEAVTPRMVLGEAEAVLEDGRVLLQDPAIEQVEDDLMFQDSLGFGDVGDGFDTGGAAGGATSTPTSRRSRTSTATGGQGRASSSSAITPPPLTGRNIIDWGNDPDAAMSESAAMMTAGGGSDVGFEDAASQATRSSITTADGALRGSLVEHYLGPWAAATPPAMEQAYAQASQAAKEGVARTRWLIMDFSDVSGLDATAARACFLMLKSLLRNAGVHLVFAALSRKVLRLLQAHGVVGVEDRVFESVDEAIEYCEELLLRDANEMSRADLAGLSRHPSYYAAVRQSRSDYLLRRRRVRSSGSLAASGVSGVPSTLAPSRESSEQAAALDLESILADYLEVDFVVGGEDEGVALLQFFEEVHVQAHECLFRSGEASEHLFFIKSGVVELQIPPSRARQGSNSDEDAQHLRPHRLMKVSDGGSFGELGFFLKRPQMFSAVAMTPCHLYRLSRESMFAMVKHRPAVACILQMAILRSLSLMTSFAVGGAAPLGPVGPV